MEIELDKNYQQYTQIFKVYTLIKKKKCFKIWN